MKMLQNFMHMSSKKIMAKYVPFVGQFWSDQVMLLDSYIIFWPLPSSTVNMCVQEIFWQSKWISSFYLAPETAIYSSTMETYLHTGEPWDCQLWLHHGDFNNSTQAAAS